MLCCVVFTNGCKAEKLIKLLQTQLFTELTLSATKSSYDTKTLIHLNKLLKS